MKAKWLGVLALGLFAACGGALARESGGAAVADDWNGPVEWKSTRGAVRSAPGTGSDAPPSPKSSPRSPAKTPAARPVAASAAEDFRKPPAEIGGGAVEIGGGDWFHGHLTLGLGLARARLTDNHRPPRPETGETFLGNLILLDLENETTWAPVATYWFARYLRVSATWESIEARTFNFNREDPYGPHGQTDGIVEMSGPVFLLEATWPLLDDTLFPHAGVGVFVGQSDFREDAFWNFNYGSQAEYEADGKPSRAPHGVYREIHVDDAWGRVAAAGLAWRPARHFQLDLDVRQTWVDADCVFGYKWLGHWKPQKYGDFTLDNIVWTLSAAYVF